MYSYDGISWKTFTVPIKCQWFGIAYGNGKFVTSSQLAYGTETIRYMYSTDGITWVVNTATVEAGRICYGNGKFVAIGSESAIYSTNGTSWTKTSLPSNQSWYDVCWGNDKFVAVAGWPSQYGAYSSDGITWIQMIMPRNTYWSGVCYGNGRFVAVASTGVQYAAYSADGISWKESYIKKDNISSDHKYTIGFGNGYFITFDQKNRAWYSTDGINWDYTTYQGSGYTQLQSQVAFGDNKFVKVIGSGPVVHIGHAIVVFTGPSLARKLLNTVSKSEIYGMVAAKKWS